MEQEHQQAIESMAAERYLLGEMTVEERDAFENHYFDCRVCAEDISTAAAFAANAREVAREERNVVPFRRRHPVSEWVSWAVAASLAMVVAGQQFVFRTATSVPAVVVAEAPARPLMFRSTERAEQGAIELRANEPGILYAEMDTGDDGYQWQIFTSDGKLLRTTSVLTVGQANEGYGVPLPPLPVGRYKVVVSGVRKGGNRRMIAEYTLLVKGA